MNKCKDCKWWDNYLSSVTYNECLKATRHNSRLMYAWGHDEGELHTKADFGCVEFEPKNQEPES